MVLGVRYGFFGAGRGGSRPTATGGAAIGEKSPWAAWNEGLRNSDPRVLLLVQQRLAPQPNAPRPAVGDEEAGQLLETLAGLRTGFLGFNSAARAMAVGVACRILDRFAVEPAPARWSEALPPLHDLLSASLAGSDANLRAAAVVEIAKLWVWLPGRSLTPVEEDSLANWKEALYRPVVRCLGNRDARTLVAAIACLGALPIDNAAAPAIPYLDNSNAEVRKQTLISFARRATLLSDEMLLKRLHDEDLAIRETAELILKTRGLAQEQISLGRLIFSPKPQQRISVIPLLKDRTDLDPIVWLIQLSRDPEEMVRISAIEALGAHNTPAVRRRLAEMARSDQSEAVRQAARKLVPSVEETTASLPPLPGAPSLNPKAN
jgi:HEAT repeat protein